MFNTKVSLSVITISSDLYFSLVYPIIFCIINTICIICQMFYPVQLLSRRRRGKLAPCWLAAMTREQFFKKYYNASAIKKIDVVETWYIIFALHGSHDNVCFFVYLMSHRSCSPAPRFYSWYKGTIRQDSAFTYHHSWCAA